MRRKMASRVSFLPTITSMVEATPAWIAGMINAFRATGGAVLGTGAVGMVAMGVVALAAVASRRDPAPGISRVTCQSSKAAPAAAA